MRALVLNGPGKPETLQMAELPIPEPGMGEIRVRVYATSLNPVDYKVSMNGLPGWVYPFVLGVDVAGVVDKVGEGVTGWKPGDRVVYHGNTTKPGGFAEYAITTAHTVAAIPEQLTFTEAAAFPCAGLTAYQLLQRKMNIKLGQSVLIHAGAGGVGGYAIQLAKALGAAVILTTASSGSFEHVRSLGADVTIDYQNDNIQERVLEATAGLGVDLIVNTLNRATAQTDLTLLAFGGQLGCIAGAPETVADFQPSSKTFTLHKVMLGGAHASNNHAAQADLATMASEFMKLMVDKKVSAMVTEVISLEDVPSELTRLSERHVKGKIVVRMI
jgi:NADPH2:quinone reductase